MTGVRAVRPGDILRTVLAVLAILPGILAGLGAWLRHRDRRRALNRALDIWGRWGTGAAGIELLVRGERHLALRPAVFCINHQSGIDPILVCALLKKDFVGVAKAEIRRNPYLGPAFGFVGTVFVDREDHEGAIRSLEEAAQALHGGVGIAIAPEGTRSSGEAVGSFKKGGFRIAQAAGVPVVPIVIHDAGQILPRGGFVMRSGAVHVTVLEPRETADWSRSTLDEGIAEIETAYRATLERGWHAET